MDYSAFAFASGFLFFYFPLSLKKKTSGGKSRLSIPFGPREAMENFTLPVATIKQTYQLRASDSRPPTFFNWGAFASVLIGV